MAIFDAVAESGYNLLKLEHTLRSMMTTVDVELEVRLDNAREKVRKGRNKPNCLFALTSNNTIRAGHILLRLARLLCRMHITGGDTLYTRVTELNV